MHRDGTHAALRCQGFPLGVMKGETYQETSADLVEGDSLLLFSDGAFEIAVRG